MEKVFFSGSIDIKILPNAIKKSIDEIKKIDNYQIIIGDALGVDILIQKYCKEINFSNVLVYSIYDEPRHIVDGFLSKKIDIPKKIKLERKKQTFKDEAMTNDSDISFVIWNEKSKGSFQNIIRAFDKNKKVRVFSSLTQRPILELTKEKIIEIYLDSNGMTVTELLEQLHTKAIYDFDKAKDLNAYLLKEKYIEKVHLDGKDFYKTLDESLCFDTFFKGKPSGVKFKYKMLEELIKKFKPPKNSYASMRG